jgi:uncharacterized protein (TIGR02594 family)
MHEIIDSASGVGAYASKLAAAGVKCVIRYYNNQNTPVHPTKCLTKDELAALFAAGLSVAVVFEQRAGATGDISDLSAANGTRDGKRALALAQSLGQPQGSAIYFAVDHDFVSSSDLGKIGTYFANAKAAIGGAYKIGAYGSGLVGTTMKSLGHVDHIWLSGSTGWTGTQKALEDGNWAIFQKFMELVSPIGNFGYDGNIVNPAEESFGQFSAGGTQQNVPGVAVKALFQVIARSGLNLRAGPGENFQIFRTLPENTIVTVTGTSGDWHQVDIEGDGKADGYMHGSYLKAVSGGMPIDLGTGKKPIDVAEAELALGVKEIPGKENNPRIVMYHATTKGGSAGDETAWCSSFVNYCVEQAGLKGTDSKGARSWHDTNWGQNVTAHPEKGDIVVFSRTGGGAPAGSGHVAFYLDQDDTTIRCLGGNQGNAVSIRRYPKNGMMGSFHYELLSIRRG